MKNAYLRFGWLSYLKSKEKTATSIKLRLDRFIGELSPGPPRQAKAHLISVIGGDTQIAAVSAAISIADRFMVEGPGVQPSGYAWSAMLQRFNTTLLPQEAIASPSRDFGRVLIQQNICQLREKCFGRLGCSVCLGFNGCCLRDSWPSSMGKVVPMVLK
jgi:hypothetical protein